MDDLKVRINTYGLNGVDCTDISGDEYGKWARETAFDGTPRYAVGSVQAAINLLESYGIGVPLFHLDAETHDRVVSLYRGADGTLKLREKRKA